MSQKAFLTAGQMLGQAEGSIGTALREAVANHYKGLDLTTAQAIRHADTDTEAAKILTAIRQGRVHEVMMIALSAASGALAGVAAQKAVNNATVAGVPAMSIFGAVPTIAGLALPISLSGRAVLTAGGLTYIAGAVIYKMLTDPPKETVV